MDKKSQNKAILHIQISGKKKKKKMKISRVVKGQRRHSGPVFPFFSQQTQRKLPAANSGASKQKTRIFKTTVFQPKLIANFLSLALLRIALAQKMYFENPVQKLRSHKLSHKLSQPTMKAVYIIAQLGKHVCLCLSLIAQ